MTRRSHYEGRCPRCGSRSEVEHDEYSAEPWWWLDGSCAACAQDTEPPEEIERVTT